MREETKIVWVTTSGKEYPSLKEAEKAEAREAIESLVDSFWYRDPEQSAIVDGILENSQSFAALLQEYHK